MKISVFAVGMLIICCSGCQKSATPQYQTWFSPAPRYVPQPNSTNAYDAYCLASLEAAKLDSLALSRVNFTPGQRAESLKNLQPALKIFRNGVGNPCEFRFQAQVPFTPHEYRLGWRLLGRALIWLTEDAIQSNSIGDVIKLSEDTTKFATDLMRGSAADADLGFSILDEQRRTLAPAIEQLSPAVLNSIAGGMERGALHSDWLKETVQNERQNMLAGVQWLQDRYQNKEFKLIVETLGETVSDSVKALESMGDATEFFSGLAKEIDVEIGIVNDALKKPSSARGELPIPEGKRPWKFFAKQLFRGLRPLVDRSDLTITRTKLLILECRLRAIAKSSGKAPTSLEAFSAELTQDPISGRPFAYSAFGSEYKVYSIGRDQLDNGGRTNEEFLSPDLLLEKRR